MKLLSLIPLWVMYLLSSAVCPLLYHVVRYRRTVVRRNLSESFPEMEPAEIRRIERRFYRFFTDMIFETVKLATISRRAIGRRMKFVNPGHVAQSLREGCSVSLFLGHHGNWEWVSSMPLHLPQDVVAGQVYRRLRNASVDRMMRRSRERMGAECIEMRDVARRVNALKGRVSIIGYIADQSPRYNQAKYYVRFLNHTIPAFTGAEKLTLHNGFEAWFLDVRRVRRGYYEAEFVPLKGDGSLTDIYYEYLERAVRRQPETYLWTHNRFKHARRD